MGNAGFTEVTQLAAARELLAEYCEPHGRTQRRSPADAVGHVLADGVEAVRPVPHYDRAAMDGYAVQAADTFGATDRSPARFERAEEIVDAGTAVQVNTGSAVPEGADAVVMVEETERRDDSLLVYDAVAERENVAPAGEDVEASQHLFEAGHRLTPSDVALLRAAGREAVPVREQPRVSVLPTGEELVDPDETPGPGEIVETNGLLVSSLVTQWGGVPSYRDVVTDEEDALRAAVEGGLDHDVVVTTGGSSVGERDLVPDVVDDLGEVLVHGISLKPGHPVGFGVVDGTPVVLLPGYPVSCLVTAVQLLRPALAWLAGTEPQSQPTVRATLSRKLPSAPGERTFARVRLEDGHSEEGGDGTEPTASPVQTGGAGVMSSVAFADGWVEVPESREGIAAGETVTVQQWERPVFPGDNDGSTSGE
ncbi:molybdopterin molybdenumtransferase MoeA [Halobacteriales archaeon QS_4_66_20]|nr:MAG: molybdopterin molybdenumtransferase MoeA [Halobacteriales archaeon QS_4_66_20]